MYANHYTIGQFIERIVGIEPTSPTWKEGVITIIRYSHFKELIEGRENFEISTYGLTDHCSASELPTLKTKNP